MIFSKAYPLWFLGYDVLFELLFLLITGLIAWYSFKAYRLSGERRFLWWGIGFLSITGGYAINAYANYYLLAHIGGAVAKPVPSTLDVHWVKLLAHIAYTGSFLAGYLLLALVTLDFDDTRLVTLFSSLVALLALGIVFSDASILFPLSLTLILAHVVLFNFLPRKRKRTTKQRRRASSGFGLLLLGQLSYLLLPLAGVAYVAGHIFELFGFGLLALTMLSVLRK